MQLEIRVKGDRLLPADNLLLSEAFMMVSKHQKEPVVIMVENGERKVRAAVDMLGFESDFAKLPVEKRGSFVKHYISSHSY